MPQKPEIYEPVVSSRDPPSNAPELFAKQLSQAPEGHKYHGYNLWMLESTEWKHYIICNENEMKRGGGNEILASKMYEFAKHEDFFTSGKDSIDYPKRKEEWLRMPKASDD